MHGKVHVLNIVRYAGQFLESYFGETVDGGVAFAVDFGFQFSQAGVLGQFDDFPQQDFRQSFAPEVRMSQFAYQADVSLPTTLSLVERGFGDDDAVTNGEKRKVAFVVNVFAPVVEYLAIVDSPFDEQAFVFRDLEVEVFDQLFVFLDQWSNFAVVSVTTTGFDGVFI